MGKLESRPFGRNGERVSVISLGGGALAKHSLDEGVATVRRALELGVTYIDTAPLYEHGASQVILGNALQGVSETYLLATKLGFLGAPELYRSPDALRMQLLENLRALRRDDVDVLQVHSVDYACWWTDTASEDELLDVDAEFDFANAPVMQVLREAREQGLCKYIGITSNRADILGHILQLVDVDVCLVAYGYNLVFRAGQRKVLPEARRRKVSYLTAGIFYPGLEARQPDWRPPLSADIIPQIEGRLAKIYSIQKEAGLSLVELGIRYLLADPGVNTIPVGAATPAEIEASVAAAEQGPLPSTLHAALEALGLGDYVPPL